LDFSVFIINWPIILKISSPDFSISANEELLKSSAYMLFTVNKNDGSISMITHLEELNLLECIGFIR
jgi:hypothetical protein